MVQGIPRYKPLGRSSTLDVFYCRFLVRSRNLTTSTDSVVALNQARFSLLTTASQEGDDVTSKRGHETLEGEIGSGLRDFGLW